MSPSFQNEATQALKVSLTNKLNIITITKLMTIPRALTMHVLNVTPTHWQIDHHTDKICQIRLKSHSSTLNGSDLFYIFFKKDEKDQILTSNVWLNLVSKFFALKSKFSIIYLRIWKINQQLCLHSSANSFDIRIKVLLYTLNTLK